MKAKKAIREALKQPWLYNDEELKKLKSKLNELEGEGVQELWNRRSIIGFSNSPEQLNG
jgi:histidinol-phosphate/aromatic aminotransferase/cobyric acid decarboxylase-like protein|tara:strand:- start:379 stop:555 length:177 start_codon:yes stop_codon:yes gene_type:complete